MNKWVAVPLAALLLTPAPPGGLGFLAYTIDLEGTPTSLIVASLNAGSTPDAAVVMRTDTTEISLQSFEGTGNGRLIPVNLTAMQQLGYLTEPILAHAQLNQDDWPDLGIAGLAGGQALFHGDGDLAYTGTTFLPTLGGTQQGLGFVDVDHDGDLDSVLLVNDLGGWFLDIGINPGDGILGGTTFVNAPGTSNCDGRLLIADMSADGRFSTFVVGGNGLAMSAFPGGPSTNQLLLAGDYEEIIAADLNGDDLKDLVVGAPNAGGVAVLLNDGAGGFLPASFFATGRVPESLIAGDLNGDGHIDLAVANRADDNVALLLGNSTGAFILTDLVPVGDGPIDIEASDLDMDGDLDLIVANFNSETLTVLLNRLDP